MTLEKEKLIYEHVGFITRLAQRFQGKIGFEDFFQAGVLGLLEAAEKFDESRGVRFLSFASRYIYFRMIEVMRTCYYPVKIPLYRNKALNRIRSQLASTEEDRKDLALSSEEMDFFKNLVQPKSHFSVESTGYEKKVDSTYIYDYVMVTEIADFLWESPVFEDRERLILFFYYGFGGKGQLSVTQIFEMWEDEGIFSSLSQVRRLCRSGKKKLQEWLNNGKKAKHSRGIQAERSCSPFESQGSDDPLSDEER